MTIATPKFSKKNVFQKPMTLVGRRRIDPDFLGQRSGIGCQQAVALIGGKIGQTIEHALDGGKLLRRDAFEHRLVEAELDVGG